jgi:uncharacterized membrane protein
MGPLYDCLLILHFLGLAIGVGTGFANMRLAIATKDFSPEDRVKFFLTASALSKNGSIGLGLLLLTGIGMTSMRGWAYTFGWGGGAFHAKLTLIVIFIGLFGYMQVLGKRFREQKGGPAAATIGKLSPFMLLTAIGIVICAVLAFH